MAKTKEDLQREIRVLRRRVRGLEKKAASRKVLPLLHSFEKAFETMQLGVTLCDLGRKILYTNPAEAEMHGYTVDELIGKDARIFAPATLWKPLRANRIPRLGRWKRESTNVRKDGSLFPVQIMSDIVLDESGAPKAFISTCEDITERKRAEKERQNLICDLEEALAKVKTLSGLLPICASCKKVRDDSGYWNQIEDYLHKRSDAEFTHGLCPACAKVLYGVDLGRDDPGVSGEGGPERPEAGKRLSRR